MKKEINHPAKSKINYSVAITSGINVAIYAAVNQGYIPADAVVDALAVGNVVALGLIGVFRTWFTKP